MATRLAAANRIADNGRMPVAYPPDADVYLPLKTSIVGRWMLGAINYTRATTATVTDNEWVMRKCIAGEARFQGARRVRNLSSYSQDISNAVWTAVSCTKQSNVTTAPDGTLTGDRVQTNAATAIMEMYQNLDVVAGKTYTYSAYVKYHNWRYIQLVGNGLALGIWYINIDLQTGTITSTTAWTGNFSGTITSVWNWWYRVSVTVTCIATLAAQHLSIAFINNASDVRIAPAVWDGTSGYYVWGMQMEDVTQQSVKTPWEYVSTNVLTGAPYHGANVDGVKYFDTDINGTPIPKSILKGFLCEWARTNICNYSDISVAWWGLIAATIIQNAWIAPDGTNSMVKIIPNVWTQSSYAYNVNVTTTASIYAVSCYVKADWLNFVQLRFSASISTGFANFDLLNWVVGARSLWTSSGIEPVTAFPWVYRIWAVTDTLLATTAAIVIQIVPAANSNTGAPITWDWVSGVLAWGMQIELWSNVSSYIPTAWTTATRNMDVLTYDVRNALANQWAFSAVFSIYDNLKFDRLALNFTTFNNNRLQFQARQAGFPYTSVLFWDGTTVRSVVSAQEVGANNIVVAWTNWVSVDMYMNNTKYSSPYIPNLIFSIVDVGGWYAMYPIFWCVRDIRIWKTRPTDTELLLLSNNP